MKASAILIVFIAFFSFLGKEVKSQQVNPVLKGNTSNEIFQYASIDEYLKNFVVYPDDTKIGCIQGTEVVKFTVTTEGKVTGIKVVNSVCHKMDEEVIRVLETTNGKWKPALKDGIPVDMEQEVSVVFTLHNSNDFVQMANAYLQKGNKFLFVKKQPEKALKYFDAGINLLPYNETLLAVRGLCRYETGDNEGAIADWMRLNEIDRKDEITTENYAELKGYPVMSAMLKK